MSIQARYPGTCPECGGRWAEGDLICAAETSERGESTWRHAVCPDSPDLSSTHPVCQVCWLTHPEGACDR